MPKTIYIAGRGVLTSVGKNMEENRVSLLTSLENIDKVKRLPTAHDLQVAEINLSNEELAKFGGLNETITRTALISMIAAKEAFDSFDLENKLDYKAGFISSNTVGGMDKSEDFINHFLADNSLGKLHQVIHHDCGAATEIVAEKLGITDIVTTLSTACSSASNAIIYAARLIRNGYLDWAIAGGTDSLSRFTLNGFNSLMILDKEKCRPFDDTRTGLNLGEGAGYIVVVSAEIAAKMKQKPLFTLSGFCNANDAFHQTASSAEGVGNYLAMKGALAEANLKAEDIDYINLHGTGTQNNDSSEATAIQRLFGDKIPPVSSTKTYTGHTLAACGGIEAVFATIAMEEGCVFPNLRFKEEMKEVTLSPTATLIHKPIRHVLSNSFGFGGNCTTLILSKTNG